jgi:hypothetical protein
MKLFHRYSFHQDVAEKHLTQSIELHCIYYQFIIAIILRRIFRRILLMPYIWALWPWSETPLPVNFIMY